MEATCRKSSDADRRRQRRAFTSNLVGSRKPWTKPESQALPKEDAEQGQRTRRDQSGDAEGWRSWEKKFACPPNDQQPGFQQVTNTISKQFEISLKWHLRTTLLRRRLTWFRISKRSNTWPNKTVLASKCNCSLNWIVWRNQLWKNRVRDWFVKPYKKFVLVMSTTSNSLSNVELHSSVQLRNLNHQKEQRIGQLRTEIFRVMKEGNRCLLRWVQPKIGPVTATTISSSRAKRYSAVFQLQGSSPDDAIIQCLHLDVLPLRGPCTIWAGNWITQKDLVFRAVGVWFVLVVFLVSKRSPSDLLCVLTRVLWRVCWCASIPSSEFPRLDGVRSVSHAEVLGLRCRQSARGRVVVKSLCSQCFLTHPANARRRCRHRSFVLHRQSTEHQTGSAPERNVPHHSSSDDGGEDATATYKAAFEQER